MKKILLFIAFIIFNCMLFGQSYTYKPFPVDTGFWQYQYHDDYHIPTGTYSNYYLSGDTIISGLNYKKIAGPYISGAIRESSKIIYFYPDTASQEYVIYNFNLNYGDTLFNPYTYNHFAGDTITVDLVDTILTADGFHARWHLTSGVTWIEGIGSDMFLLNSLDAPLISGHDVLEYMEGDSIIKYNSPSFPPPPPPNCLSYYSTTFDSLLNTFNLHVPTPIAMQVSSYLWNFGDGTTSNLPSASHYYPIDSIYNVCLTVVSTSGHTCSYCHLIGKDTAGNIMRAPGFFLNANTTGIEATDEIESSVFPNPTIGNLNIELSKPVIEAELRIRDIKGKTVFEKRNINGNYIVLDITDLYPGMYFIEIRHSEEVYRHKIIRQ